MPNPDVPNLPVNANQPTSTLFPPLNGGAPADAGAQESQDITGQWLPPLSESVPSGDFPDPNVATGRAIPSTGAPPLVPQAPSGREASIVLDQPPPARQPRTVQDRINRLTKQWRQAEEQKSTLERQLDTVVQQLATQDAYIRQLATGQASLNTTHARQPDLSHLVSPDQPTTPLVPAAPSPSSRPLTADDVRSIVTGAIQDYASQSTAQSQRIEALRLAHEESFNDAVEEFPELADPRTHARQLFEKIYAGSPLRALPNAPYQIALQVQGILVGEGRQAAPGLSAEDRKRAASVPMARPTPQDIPDSQRGAYQKRFEELSRNIRAGDNSFETYREWRHLRGVVGPK